VISQIKEILKLWVDFYKRFDTLKRGDRGRKMTDWRGIMLGETEKGEKLEKTRGDEIFNLDSEELKDLRNFLSLFS
jgi:hypothetical protein